MQCLRICLALNRLAPHSPHTHRQPTVYTCTFVALSAIMANQPADWISVKTEQSTRFAISSICSCNISVQLSSISDHLTMFLVVDHLLNVTLATGKGYLLMAHDPGLLALVKEDIALLQEWLSACLLFPFVCVVQYTSPLLVSFSAVSECAWQVSCFLKLSDAFFQLQKPFLKKAASAFLVKTSKPPLIAVEQ